MADKENSGEKVKVGDVVIVTPDNPLVLWKEGDTLPVGTVVGDVRSGRDEAYEGKVTAIKGNAITVESDKFGVTTPAASTVAVKKK
jgi:hypothetical protein